tara:strand:- start:705 stop:2279 length:1575 start_codon:yes stop_codon:yes gene_type:complete
MSEEKWFDKSLILKDGTELVSRIWIPAGEGPWPALLMRQPYGRELASTITYSHPSWWASKGYMVIIQDVRGLGSSGGVFQGFSQEASDTSQTHEWVRSLKECNGMLGLYGFSYQGLTQLTGEDYSKPPDCLSPAMTGINIREHWCSDGGAFWWHNNIAWGLQIAALKLKKENNFQGWEEIRLSLENKSYLRNGLNLLKKYDSKSFVIEWLNILENEDPFFKIEPLSSWIKKPMLIIGGLWDPHLKGALDLYIRSIKQGGNPEIIIGNATHLDWWKGSQKTLLNFFNKHLKENNTSDDKNNFKNKKIWNISLNKWNDLEDNHEQELLFGLKSNGSANFEVLDGTLTINKKGSGSLTIVHDPWRPAPSDGGHLGPNPGSFKRNIIDNRLDIGVFQTYFFKEDHNLKGIPILETSVISDQSNFDICLALSLVDKNNDVNQFSTGFLRVKNSKKNESSNYVITMQPTNISLTKGTRLRLSISAAAYPSIGVNPGFGKGNIGAPSINHKIITLNFELKKTFMKMTPFFT